jgi:hypothetical protein
MPTHDFYELLGVSHRAGKEEIKKAFYRLAQAYHPDKNPGDAIAAEEFKKINEAYQTLSDPEKKFRYDQINGVGEKGDKSQEVYFLHQTASHNKILLNEEVEICFAFPSDGRFFKREKFTGWFLSSGPIVERQEIIYEGKIVKQTLLKYVLSAQMHGTIIIPPASVTIQNKRISGEALAFTVSPNACFFREGEMAGSNPYQVSLYYLKEIKAEKFTKTIRQEHIVLIPRSNVAAYVHFSWKYIDLAIKILVITILHFLGMRFILALGISIILSMLLKQVYFKIKKVKQARTRAYQHPLIKKYLLQGYEISVIGIEWPWMVWYNGWLKKRIVN